MVETKYIQLSTEINSLVNPLGFKTEDFMIGNIFDEVNLMSVLRVMNKTHPELQSDEVLLTNMFNERNYPKVDLPNDFKKNVIGEAMWDLNSYKSKRVVGIAYDNEGHVIQNATALIVNKLEFLQKVKEICDKER